MPKTRILMVSSSANESVALSDSLKLKLDPSHKTGPSFHSICLYLVTLDVFANFLSVRCFSVRFIDEQRRSINNSLQAVAVSLCAAAKSSDSKFHMPPCASFPCRNILTVLRSCDSDVIIKAAQQQVLTSRKLSVKALS